MAIYSEEDLSLSDILVCVEITDAIPPLLISG